MAEQQIPGFTKGGTRAYHRLIETGDLHVGASIFSIRRFAADYDKLPDEVDMHSDVTERHVRKYARKGFTRQDY
jgi:hypothetical protein